MTDDVKTRVNALCKRSCAFVLYRLPGEEQPLQFCMQQDGGSSATAGEGRGFIICRFDKQARIIADECRELPATDKFPELPPAQPDCPATSREEYHRCFCRYMQELKGDGPLRKIVQARTKDIPASAPDPAGLLHKCCERYPRNFNALFHLPEYGTWLCSTPELLLQGTGNEWESMSLAGTRPAGTATDWDAKNTHEQQLVTDYITNCLQPVADSITTQGPFTLTAGPVEHLCTRLNFHMEDSRLPLLLSTLPPTPAVCGTPLETARELLQQYPDIRRECYAGYLGLTGPGSTRLFVTLRCVQIFADRYRFYAGGGLLTSSDEAAEWLETEAKIRTLESLLS